MSFFYISVIAYVNTLPLTAILLYITLKGLGSFIFMNKINTFIQQAYIKLIKCGNKCIMF